MKIYGPNEVAELLNIKPATLRKYSIMLEERGYKIERNSQNHRYYQDKDIITLRNIIRGKDSGVTLDESINNIISIDKHNSYTNDINNVVERDNNDIQEIKELVHNQNELIKELTTRLDK